MLFSFFFTFLLLYLCYKVTGVFRNFHFPHFHQPKANDLIMGGGQSKAEAAAQAEVEDQVLKEQQRRQALEVERQREEMNRQRKERADQRKAEMERAEAEDLKHENMLKETMRLEKERKDAERAQEETRNAQQAAQIKTALENGSKALDNQRNFNAEQINRSNTDHQNVLTREIKTREAVENKTSERVNDLSKQRVEAQEKLHAEKEKYSDKQLTETKEHHERMAISEERKVEALLERDRNHEEHLVRITAINTQAVLQRQGIIHAVGQDRVEVQFVDVVNNVRGGARDLETVSANLGAFVTSLNNGFSLQRSMNICLATHTRAQSKLITLRENVTAILEVKGGGNADVLPCQTAARAILVILGELEPLLTGVRVYLVETHSDEQKASAIQHIGNVQETTRRLSMALIDMPVPHRSNFAITQIRRNVEAWANGQVMNTKSPELQQIEQSPEDPEPVVNEAE